LLSRSRSRNLKRLARSPRSISRFRACWAVQAAWPGAGHAEDVDCPGLDLHHEQHAHALQQDSIDVQEITCQDPGRLSGQELRPCRRCTARCGPEPGSGQDPADRPLPGPVPQPDELTLGYAGSPSAGSAGPAAQPASAPPLRRAVVPLRSDRSISW
jgi:hypothetical protein